MTLILFLLISAYNRARIESLPKGKKDYKVMFVDYGTTEYVNRFDIFTEVDTHNIPVQVQKYRLSSVVPMPSCNNEWPQITLDFIHGEIVDFEVLVRVKTKLADVNECSILKKNNFELVELEKNLVEKNLATWRKEDDAWPPTKKPVKELRVFSDCDRLNRIRNEIDRADFGKWLDNFFLPELVDVNLEETKEYLKRRYFETEFNEDSL